MAESDFCNEFLNRDLRFYDQCKDAVEGCDWVFNLAVRRTDTRTRPLHPPPPRPSLTLSRHPACTAAGGHGRHGLHPVQPLAHPVQLDDDQLRGARAISDGASLRPPLSAPVVRRWRKLRAPRA